MNVIEVSNVSKRFLLGSGSVKSMLLDRKERKQSGESASSGREFWALQDVSFKVPRGASLGIVGHNGSGKSTMLKLLTGILEPTTGSITTRGRIGALIEVGAGFHPDLTGRENVYLNGSILGLSEREIGKRFDEIVEFAGLEQFIDTPVKRYSSGMYMRLGFSIAAHINPDILIVDEVLAVGDQMFQNKCMRRMKEFMAQGGTVIFVSHAMAQMAQLCEQCVWLDHGQILYHGKTRDAVDRYMTLVREREEEEYQRKHSREWTAAQKDSSSVFDLNLSRIEEVVMYDKNGVEKTRFQAGEPVTVEIRYRFSRPLINPVFGFEIYRDDQVYMFGTSNYDYGVRLDDLSQSGGVSFNLEYLSLNEGMYRVRVRLFPDGSDLREGSVEHVIDDALRFAVTAGPHAHGCAFMPVRWNINERQIQQAPVSVS